MAQPDLPADGGCRCGKLRFRITAPPLLTSACHCRGCQRMTASAFSLTVTVPDDGFALTQGEPVIGGMHGDQGHHHHCDWCKSWVFTTITPTQGFVNVRATMLDDAAWFTPFAEMQVAEKLAWVHLPARRSYDRFPAMDEYAPLIAAFTAGA